MLGQRRSGDVLAEINHNEGGRSVYYPIPDGQLLEIIVRFRSLVRAH